jgi:septation ring formation regulator EzrA
MKKWLVIVSVVALLLAISTGVGFFKFRDAKAELISIKAQLTDIEAQLTSMKTKLTEIEENGGYWWEQATEPTEGYWWEK